MLIRLSPAKQIGRQIRQQRRLRRLTQAELAKRAGTSQAAVARIEAETANPTLGSLTEIAKAMNLHIEIRLRRS